MRHFQPRSFKAAFDVEAFVGFGAVENGFVAADLLRDVVQGLDDFESEFTALLRGGYGYIFDMADYTEVMDKFPLHN